MENESPVDQGRRALLGAAFATVVASPLAALPAPETVDLWPGDPPESPGPRLTEHVNDRGTITGVARPRLNVFRPPQPNGTALVVIAGGGYVRIGAGHESTPACQWLQSLGVTAFELIYRLPGDGWPPRAPLQDAQRALRLVRAGVRADGLAPDRIGVLGFSAGGHLAGMTAVRPATPLYKPVDTADTASARPDFAALIYPVISMLPPLDHTRSRREMLGSDVSEGDAAAFSVDRQVDRETPRTFLAHAADDPIAAVDHSLRMFDALRRMDVPAELHVFQSGGHGWGLGLPGAESHAWPGLFAAWMVSNKLFPPQPSSK
ncbi:alpha/beta hydrolase [Lichenifustis flavocetrariae]|uniref:Alpha/beta hydrolase n=1 Tax=Lichenifustis flavocetrariae TaxID=2949735 RepID=A0AA41YVW3_9HYPH|nr:alpha/beta hydrolase [Lichenifustis flavocetrariae]MCW6508186.1 alpha/beta hydrolase [Lichenifustis flavocetrariae]